MGEEDTYKVDEPVPVGEAGNEKSMDEREESGKNKRKKHLLKAGTKEGGRGVCYLSRVPPRMDHVKLRQILSQYGEIDRIFLAPEKVTAQIYRKQAGGFRGQGFSEGWAEFIDKRVAKRTANFLNGEQIGGRKRSQFYYDIWNIKYLSRFKWDDLTEEIAYKSAVREQKLALEISAAKREKDFYMSRVEKSRALACIEERRQKKQKLQQDLGSNSEPSVGQPKQEVFRQFPQKQPIAENKVVKSKGGLSKDLLAQVFGRSS